MSKQVLKQVSPHTSVWVDEEDKTMNNKKQSSVEYLGYELNTKLFYNISPELWEEVNKIFEQAKAKHKQEIIDAANKLLYHGTGPGDTAAEQYYNETFGGQDNE